MAKICNVSLNTAAATSKWNAPYLIGCHRYARASKRFGPLMPASTHAAFTSIAISP